MGQPFDAIDRLHKGDDLVNELLQGTSRTFALAIPLLSAERRQQIGLAYLLFRVADSLEDAPEADVTTKIRLLQMLRATLVGNSAESNRLSAIRDGDLVEMRGHWPAESATERLMHELPRLLKMLLKVTSPAANAIRVALTQTIDGMTHFMEASQLSSVQIHIKTISDLQSYCYVVAGIVGEMLTDLFVAQHAVSRNVAHELRSLSVGFGECLQLTNILKDADSDVLDGRVFSPALTSRATVIELAFRATGAAKEYICLLEANEFPGDVVAFCRFLYLLAEGTLNRLQTCEGTNKLTREEVMLMLNTVRPPAASISV